MRDGYVMDLAIQTDGKIVIGGAFYSVDCNLRNSIARLNSDGSLDISFNPGSGANGRVDAIAIQPDGKILIGGSFITIGGVDRKHLARLNPDGSVDTSFDPGNWDNGGVASIILQPDGMILVGGGDDQDTIGDSRIIFRLHSDGSQDPSFNPGNIEGKDDLVYLLNIGLQPDGKVIIAGWFFQIDGVERNYIARLNIDGSLDLGFDPGTGPNGNPSSMVIQPDGSIVIGGWFTSFDGTNINRIARLRGNGALDSTYDTGSGVDSSVEDLAYQADGKILIGGIFHTVNGISRNSIARLNIDGSLDIGFSSSEGADGRVYEMVVQPDGKVLLGGGFNFIHGASRGRIARLNANGTLDLSFNPGSISGYWISTMALQSDGKIVIGGFLTSVNGYSHYKIARLNTDGTVDTSYNPGCEPNYYVHALAIQPDDKVLVGGLYHFMNNVKREKIARLNTDGSLDTSFDPGTGTNFPVLEIGVQPDEKVLIVGEFT